MKVNIDAAIFEDLGCIGVSSVLRDADGSFISARNHKVTANYRLAKLRL